MSDPARASRTQRPSPPAGSSPNDELLWAAPDQHQRLAELVSDVVELKEVPLRHDVRSLGKILGDTLAEQVSPEFLATVERLRVFMVTRREQENGGQQSSINTKELALEKLSLEQARQIVKAF